MPTSPVSRYGANFRRDEIELIIRFAQRGDSLALVGLAGIGQSNLVNFLRQIHQYASQLGQDVSRLHFPVVDATYWEGTPLSLWKIMLDALNQASAQFSPPPEPQKIIPISEEERVLNMIRSRLHWLCTDLGQRVMIVLDDFDEVLQAGPLSMLERLNGFRSEGHRDALSYLVLTKRLPHLLGQSYNLADASKFYDLFRHHIYALEPYGAEDAHQMLKHLNEAAGSPLREKDLSEIRQLAGGHPLLLKSVFELWAAEGMTGVNPLTHLAEQPDVQQECRRILQGLHPEEQDVLIRAARDALTEADEPVVKHLVRRGVLTADTHKLFSPLLDQFLTDYEG
ncbi:MAG: hypothetical protein L6R45_30910 [Anaerolineae bacterium]|nr:hypothetical protein [Anaerolineae bacterium]